MHVGLLNLFVEEVIGSNRLSVLSLDNCESRTAGRSGTALETSHVSVEASQLLG